MLKREEKPKYSLEGWKEAEVLSEGSEGTELCRHIEETPRLLQTGVGPGTRG